MKYFIISGLLLFSLVSGGQVLKKDLPKPVAKFVAGTYGKEEVVLTEKEISANVFASDKFFAIHRNGSSELKGYLHFGRVNTCRAEGCSAPGKSEPAEKSEYFDYTILYTPALEVEDIRIYNYQASYGHEITARGWLRQFKGFSGEKTLEVGKHIDGISGATISVNAITEDVQWKTRLLKEIVQ
jgi:hypothetical protein